MRFTAAAVAAVLAGGVCFAGQAGAAPADAADSVTAYAGYPGNEVPAGCDATDITGVTFSLNGGAPTSNPQSLPDLRIGDEVTMTWAAVNVECVGAPVSLSMKEAPGPTFDPTVDQQLLSPYERVAATAGAGSVTLPINQPILVTCFYQLDGTVGRPLFIVGPGGNYYSSSFGGSVARSDERSVLLGASNGQVPDCTPGTTTTTTAPAPPPETTVPAPPSTTSVFVPLSPPPSEPGCVTGCAGQLEQTVARATLPATGVASGTLKLVGALAVLAGLVILLAARGIKESKR